jgi:hypothetical protein
MVHCSFCCSHSSSLSEDPQDLQKRDGNKKLKKSFIMLPAPTYLQCKTQTNKKTEEKFIATVVRTSSGVGEFLRLQAP